VPEVGVDHFLSCTRALADGFYQELAPPRDLADFVACTWVRLVRCAHGAMTDSILPDGCADIMVYDDEPPYVAGPDATTRRVVLLDGLAIVGIRLRPGACRAVLGCSAAEIVNGGAWLRDIVKSGGRLHRMMLAAPTRSSRLAVLEDWVREALVGATDNDRAVIAACRLLSARSRTDVGEVARRLDWNARMIHRQFLAACGYGPKHFHRIMRIQEALRLARNEVASRRLADLAATAGYADQAHMTRDFRAITGFTPSAYFAQMSPGWSAWIEGW
jgi:AraC-like DNA-binding protein